MEKNLTATVDGDNVNLQSANHITAYRTLDGTVAWSAAVDNTADPNPPFLTSRLRGAPSTAWATLPPLAPSVSSAVPPTRDGPGPASRQ